MPRSKALSTLEFDREQSALSFLAVPGWLIFQKNSNTLKIAGGGSSSSCSNRSRSSST